MPRVDKTTETGSGASDRAEAERGRPEGAAVPPHRRPPDEVAEPDAPEGPTQLSRRSLIPTLKRTVAEFQEDNLTDWAAALTYYGVLAMFPALIVMVSLVGLFADPAATTQTVTAIVQELGPASAVDTFTGPIESITSNEGTAGVLFVVGLVAALFSASGYVGAFMRASNKIYETEEGRPFWHLRPLQMGITLGMVLLLAAVSIALVLTGPLVEAIAGPLGIGETAVTVWSIAKWPVLVVVVVFMIGVLYYTSPNVRPHGFRWVTPGSMLALVLWAIASIGFAFYVANFGSYDKTYGTLGGVITFLVWLWITNIAVLLGAELNAELERSRELEAGVAQAEHEIQLAPRAEPNEPKTK
jgi:membrane protein